MKSKAKSIKKIICTVVAAFTICFSLSCCTPAGEKKVEPYLNFDESIWDMEGATLIYEDGALKAGSDEKLFFVLPCDVLSAYAVTERNNQTAEPKMYEKSSALDELLSDLFSQSADGVVLSRYRDYDLDYVYSLPKLNIYASYDNNGLANVEIILFIDAQNERLCLFDDRFEYFVFPYCGSFVLPDGFLEKYL